MKRHSVNFNTMRNLLVKVRKACKTRTPNNNAANELQRLYNLAWDNNARGGLIDDVEFELIQYFESLALDQKKRSK